MQRFFQPDIGGWFWWLWSKMEQKMSDELTLSSTAVKTVKQMLLEVPNPTVEELQKLLAVQGHILNSLGIGLISESKKNFKFRDKREYVKLALECLRESRMALDSAIKAEESKPK